MLVVTILLGQVVSLKTVLLRWKNRYGLLFRPFIESILRAKLLTHYMLVRREGLIGDNC
jgi:hypothetical protein